MDEIKSFRSLLRSDDHLQIQPSGDYEQVRIKLDHDIQISFFFDSLQPIAHSLTIKDVHDFRMSKASNKCPLNNDQWTNLRQCFDKLVQDADHTTTLRSIIQSIQDQLLQMRVATNKYKPKEKKSTTTQEEDDFMSSKFRGADLIFSRILHDKTIDRGQVIIGYEDRFTGIHEIQFNEFKKVHDHEYGVPMHRIRHFKINGRTVWDRTQKLDTLTGSEQQNGSSDDATRGLPMVQGLYQFDRSLERWVQHSQMPLPSDDAKTLSTNETSLPQQCHFLSWNILFDYHHSALIHTPQRYQAILHTLKSLLPDLICLQEVTAQFFRLLFNEMWLHENNYSVIVMQSVISSEQDKSYGQLMLMKNFRPRSFSICSLDVSLDGTSSTTIKTTKEIIVARFGLSAKVTIDIVNLHLHSNLSRQSNEKRCQALENLFKKLKTNNYMLIGDFNFGDYDLREQNLLEKYEDEIHDLWKDVYNLEENPGFTFDPSRNLCARITSESQINRRFDRYFIHTLQNLHYSVEHLNMIGIDSIPIDPFNNDHDKRINQSDHYGLQLIMNFRTRSVSRRSALVILPPTNQWPLIEPYREQYDSSVNRWPPHFNLLWPFFDLTDCEDDQENILVPLRLLLSRTEAFTVEVNGIGEFTENNICFMKLNEQSTENIKRLYEQVKQLFPQCCIQERNGYNPHMTIAQFGNEENRKEANLISTFKGSFQFPIQNLYILQRAHDNDSTPFHITYQLPLGSVLQPLHSQPLNSVHSELQQLFHQLNLHENQLTYQRKQDKFIKLASCFEEMFNTQTLHCFHHVFLPYGSFRIGINGEDLDTIFVLTEMKSNDAKTSFDRTLYELKTDSNALKDHLISLLETQINAHLKDEIQCYRKVQAVYTILLIVFKDKTKVEIAIEIKTINEHTEGKTSSNDSNSKEYLPGVHDIEHLFVYVRSPLIFQHLLTFIRTWAQRVGFYGQVYGYLGGYSWAILCAHICHSFLSPIESLSTIDHFSIDHFFSLVQRFFFTYANFNWSSGALRLYEPSYKSISSTEKVSFHNRGAMRIISPIPPYNNTGRSTLNSTRDLITQGFQRVVELLDGINTITDEDKSNALKQILHLTNDFPNEKIKSLIQLTLSGEDENELNEWIGWLKSRVLYFLNECENKCHLSIQTPTTILYRSNDTEAIYYIGFQLDEQTLNHHRNFSSCLNQFLEQFNLCPNRKETMKITQKLISIHDWKLEQMQPKPQRIRK